MCPNDTDEKVEISCNDLSQRDARGLLFHLLYAMEGYDYDVSLEAIVDNFARGYDVTVPLDSDVFKTAQSIIDARDALDESIKPFLANWRFERISVCTKLILRIAVWEMQNSDVAATIIINEAIELAKSFAEQDAYRFVNGILDAMAKEQDQADQSE